MYIVVYKFHSYNLMQLLFSRTCVKCVSLDLFLFQLCLFSFAAYATFDVYIHSHIFWRKYTCSPPICFFFFFFFFIFSSQNTNPLLWYSFDGRDCLYNIERTARKNRAWIPCDSLPKSPLVQITSNPILVGATEISFGCREMKNCVMQMNIV